LKKRYIFSLIMLLGLFAVCSLGTGTVSAATNPTVTSSDPTNNAGNVNSSKVVTVTFSKTIKAGTNYNNILVKNTNDNSTKSVSKAISGNTLVITPTNKWLDYVKYQITIPSSSISDTRGYNLLSTYTTSFTVNKVAAAPAGVTTVSELNSAISSAVSGDTIYIGGTTFNLSGLTLNKNLILQGAGQNQTIFNGNGQRILSVGNYKVTINDIQFKGGKSTYGGAINNDGTLTLNRDLFTGNTATQYGGAINNENNLTVVNCTFTNNTAPGVFEIGYGSGSCILNNNGCYLFVDKSTFTYNSAGSYAAIFQLGDGTINNSYFGYNTAGEGAAIFTSTGGTSKINNDTFEYNKAVSGAGGALDNYHAISTVIGCKFTGNSALVGGAIYNDGQDQPNLTNSNFIVNSCTFTANKATSGGGAIMTYRGTAAISNSTFTNNSSPNGGALYNYKGVFILSNNNYSGNTSPNINEEFDG
jgi:predicted outer membrane repeat protein